MKKGIYILLCLLWSAIQSVAQSTHPLTDEATRLYDQKDLNSAQTIIQKALNDPKEKGDSYTWYVAGFIQKEIYKAKETNNRTSASRKEAVRLLEKSILLDTKREHIEMSHAALRYLAVSYFNDALTRTREITKESAHEPEELYTEFRRIMRIINPSTDFSEYDKQIFKAMGEAYYRMWEYDSKDVAAAAKANEYFQKVLIVDDNDCEALFDLVILNYNQGVYKIRSIDLNTDLSDLIPMQESAIRYFNIALPYAERCFANCPKKVEYYKGLMFCNRSLGKEERYLELKNELEQFVQTQKK